MRRVVIRSVARGSGLRRIINCGCGGGISLARHGNGHGSAIFKGTVTGLPELYCRERRRELRALREFRRAAERICGRGGDEIAGDAGHRHGGKNRGVTAAVGGGVDLANQRLAFAVA